MSSLTAPTLAHLCLQQTTSKTTHLALHHSLKDPVRSLLYHHLEEREVGSTMTTLHHRRHHRMDPVGAVTALAAARDVLCPQNPQSPKIPIGPKPRQNLALLDNRKLWAQTKGYLHLSQQQQQQQQNSPLNYRMNRNECLIWWSAIAKVSSLQARPVQANLSCYVLSLQS